MTNECLAVWCGQMTYSRALDLQMKICELKKRGFRNDVLLLLEHSPVITLGRSADRQNLLVTEELLQSRGVELYSTDRGGDITYHGPGQLVGYPILALQQGERDVRAYMRNLEGSLIRLLDTFGIEGARDEGYTGVWTANGKIAAMGVHISRWITRHGFALNVHTDLSYFDLIVPCGIVGKSVTSMQNLLERDLDLRTVSERYMYEFGETFQRRMTETGISALSDELDHFQSGLPVLPNTVSHAT